MPRIEHYVEKVRPFKATAGVKVPWGVFEVLMDDGHVQAVNFTCPCGCGQNCFLYCPTDKRKRERPDGARARHLWDYSNNGNGPTLTPSIHWQSGCHAHFYIRNGKVEWC